MPTWYIVFKRDEQGNLRTKVRKYDAAQFDAIAKSNEFEGHEVIGMWAIDHETERADVINCHGERLPADIHVRFKAWKARNKPRPADRTG